MPEFHLRAGKQTEICSRLNVTYLTFKALVQLNFSETEIPKY